MPRSAAVLEKPFIHPIALERDASDADGFWSLHTPTAAFQQRTTQLTRFGAQPLHPLMAGIGLNLVQQGAAMALAASPSSAIKQRQAIPRFTDGKGSVVTANPPLPLQEGAIQDPGQPGQSRPGADLV